MREEADVVERRLGGLAAQGAFKGNDQRASFEGSLTAIGTQMSGRIDATLGARPSFSANLRIPGTLDLDDWLGVTDGPVPVVPTPALPATPGVLSPVPSSTGKNSPGMIRRRVHSSAAIAPSQNSHCGTSSPRVRRSSRIASSASKSSWSIGSVDRFRASVVMAVKRKKGSGFKMLASVALLPT